MSASYWNGAQPIRKSAYASNQARKPPERKDRAEPASGHDERGRQREIRLARDRYADVPQVPVETDARDARVMGRNQELRVIAAKREDEIAGVAFELGIGRLEPNEKRKPTGQLAGSIEQVRVRGQHRHHRQHAVVRGEADLDRHLDDNERRDRGAGPLAAAAGSRPRAAQSRAVCRTAP